MIPLGDDNTGRKSTPVVTYMLILLNIIVFLLELAGGEPFIIKWAFVPSRFLDHPTAGVPTIFTSMFMHAGWGHLIGNMIYLWIFGDNVEDRFGKVKFIIFYLFCGVAATLAQLTFNTGSNVPNVGASGAIAGVLGAYIFMFPKAKINVALGSMVTQMSALVVIGFWFVLQFLSTLGSTSEASGQGDTGGVAYMAHVGGFITGLVLTIFLQSFERNKS